MDFDVPSTTQGQLKTIKLCQILIHFSELCSYVKPYSSQICNDQSKCEEQRRVYPFYIALVKNNNNIYINIKRSHPTEKARGQDRQNKTERARQKEQDKMRKRQDRKNKTERARGQDKMNKTDRAR